jgi:hypothetical protein
MVRRRLRRGARDYGDASFARPVTDLLDEIEQELADVAGGLRGLREAGAPARACRPCWWYSFTIEPPGGRSMVDDDRSQTSASRLTLDGSSWGALVHGVA